MTLDGLANEGDDSVDLHTYVYDIDLHVDIIIDIFIMVI